MDIASRKEKVLQGSHTMSLQGNVGPSDGDVGGAQRQAANHDRQVALTVLREDMVYPLSGNSASNSEGTARVSGGGAPSSKTLRGVN